jgi:Bacteriophage related domain of unknown function
MSQAIVRKSFETRLKTWADAQTPAIPVAWQNVAFNPPAGRYVRAFLLPAETQSRMIERTDRELAGVFQVSLCLPLDKGAGSSETLTASLDAAFSDRHVQDGVTVWLTRPFSASPAIQEPDRYVAPVSAEYRAYV